MKWLAFDTETRAFSPGCMAPPLTCVTTCDGGAPLIFDHIDGPKVIAEHLAAGGGIFGHNVAYDTKVLIAECPDLFEPIVKAYEENRITCTLLRQQLADIGDGVFDGYLDSGGVWRKRKYSLEDLSMRLLRRQLKKDAGRKLYGDLRWVPFSKWSAGQIDYPLEDARATWDLYQEQEKRYPPEWTHDQFPQARAQFWLGLSSDWGLRTNADQVYRLKQDTEKRKLEVEAELVAAGLVRKDGSRDTKKAQAHMIAVCTANEVPLKLTPTGRPCLDEDACNDSDDSLMSSYALYTSLGNVISKDLKFLLRGAVEPVHTRYNLAATGRTTSSKPNIQNLRTLPGIRECFTPREGTVFAQADYTMFELCALGQICKDLFGSSLLADTINRGEDVHLRVASEILGRAYEDLVPHRKEGQGEVYDARQTGKVANFGLPGGLGPDRLKDFAKSGYDVTLTREQAQHLKDLWFRAFPEMRQYFGYIRSLRNGDAYDVTQFRSNRLRGKARYTAACNSLFQGLAADAAKTAGWLIMRACYLDEESPLYGSRTVYFGHDEFILESPEDGAPEASEELSRLMVLAAKEYMPDIEIKAEPCLMARWSKEAQTVRDEKGRLQVWS